jgi:hypothetical protein
VGSDSESGGGFGWGLVIGGLVGFAAGAYLASGPGRDQVDSLRMRTIELTGRSDELRARARAAAERARTAAGDPESPMRRALQEGIAAARRRRAELEAGEGGVDLQPGPVVSPEPPQGMTPEENR